LKVSKVWSGPNDTARIDAEGSNQIEGTWIVPAVDMDEHTRREQRLGHRDGGGVIELSQRPMFVNDGKSLIGRTIANHRGA
jgi:hypothetical protein